ncbi:MAG: DUF1343 domain-containing protein [Bacteriovoracales bacterium]|nr:DUF1343 domain-containing protein [Bacteriovoracales bacterium]
MKTQTGLERLLTEKDWGKKLPGNIGLLCHQSSVDSKLRHGAFLLKDFFGPRIKKIFSPQHGFVGNVQDNMVESDHFHHEHLNLPVYSLYSETRAPTGEMLEGLDIVLVDLQDVGTRVYTFISTVFLMMEACAEKGIEVVILDRPNPIGGQLIEGNILEKAFSSFVGLRPLPSRHAMTMGETALWAKRYGNLSCPLRVVEMKGYRREYLFSQTGLPWVPPSPNMPIPDSALPFPGTVIFEGTSMSEGRGTTRPLEIVGHPALDPWKHLGPLENHLKGLRGFTLRPCIFLPTFQKHGGKNCGGYQLHVTDPMAFRPWRTAQLLCHYFYRHIEGFSWALPPYEYEDNILPIDLINGTDRLRLWIEKNGQRDELDALEKPGLEEFRDQKRTLELYPGS